MKCPKCEIENPDGNRFCGGCGTQLESAGTLRELPPIREPDGERRHLTVLFCDLVNSTAISAGLDPEQWHAIAAQYQRMAADAVTKIGGHVAKYLGDGLVVYFGYPKAEEDATECAVRAGMAIVETMTALNAQFANEHQIKLQVRVGIHTGIVVVAQGGGKESLFHAILLNWR